MKHLMLNISLCMPNMSYSIYTPVDDMFLGHTEVSNDKTIAVDEKYLEFYRAVLPLKPT